MYTIYKISNTINDKIYIGQTRQLLKTRMNGHKKAHTLIGMAIRKYGVQNFSIECIDTAESNEQALIKEKYYIDKFNCHYPNGYNGVQNHSNNINSTHIYITLSKEFVENSDVMESKFLKYIIKLLPYIRWDFYCMNKNKKIKNWTDIYALACINSETIRPEFRKFCNTYKIILSDEENNKYANSKYFALCEDNNI